MTNKIHILALAAFIGLFGLTSSNSAFAAKNTAATNYMKKVATALVNAQRTGTRASFRSAIQKYSDIPSIAMYSLGRYKSGLKKNRRSKYFRGVNAFMGRYFANQSRDYVVAKTAIDPNVKNSGKNIIINTNIKLDTGTNYTVVWHLSKRGRSFKIVDVKVLGFSLIYLQRGMFTSYLRKKNGNVDSLIAALNRHY